MDGLLAFASDDDGDDYGRLVGVDSPREKTIQVILSLIIGVSAFLTFCVLRPRWTGIYAARKKHKDSATAVPELPTSLFGWIVPLWTITDQQVLACAGLDAYAFLAFFKMAMKFLAVALFFSLVVIKPVHDAHPPQEEIPDNKTHHHNGSHHNTFHLYSQQSAQLPYNLSDGWFDSDFETDYLWMYVVLTYLFSTLAIYLMISGTRRIIEVRQEYLGTQTTITDRTMRLSGIPMDLRDEERIKEFIESLDIGKVERVTLCRNWKELDEAVVKRTEVLRKLEEAYTIFLGRKRIGRNLESLPIAQPTPPDESASSQGAEDREDDENSALIGANGIHPLVPERTRPKTRVRYGFMKWHTRQVDAIDYYEEKMREADEKVKELRLKTFSPVSLAFVTMDSVAACQMAIQAVLDPSPLQLIASQSPAPEDVIWPNTYLSRRNRIIRAWCITSLIVLLTLLWSSIFVGVAGLLTVDSITKVFPQLKDLLNKHENVRSLVTAQLPPLLTSLMIVLVPYLYYWLSWYQGFMSQGDIELSAISKNFFFTFFNFFVVFTISGAGIKFYEIFKQVGDALQKDVWKLAYSLAKSLQRLLSFYVNLIVLQGLGLFPFRLLEMGSVSLYPVYRIGAKTPRDYAELVQPPTFSYGFYLPNALLIFIICMVYSVLRDSWQVILAGLIYFAFGHFVYKYQLLYAMDNQQQATGRAWVMICDRIFVGLIFFQVATMGQLILQKAVTRMILMLPLVIATVWIWIIFGRTYRPLMKFIALRSVKRGESYTDTADSPSPPPEVASSRSSTDLAPERNVWADVETPQPRDEQDAALDSGLTMKPPREKAVRFFNPSLVAPLDGLWIADKNFRRELPEATVPEGEDSV
ncbi:hypothetical protein BDY17DRAFT_300640 [Neohortaea acidophila]|uniref:DUF221-domain-containing protein n=1 Tax=Neohortaea acidophila TaxID=245834 RepID=A0A6A6PMC5_9PEZI|nr:uncharacterized protein BDY17DRAFT_300640 [Neohortaea acidophila]KAF2481065.1 hypothetical protein BDY17DRAFT_300640 [Neohortaea acidophila]